MSLQNLQDELAAWSSPTTAAARVEDIKDDLSMLILGELSDGIKTDCIQTLARLESNGQQFINCKIAAYTDAVNDYNDYDEVS